MIKLIKKTLLILSVILITACGPDITGVWDISGAGEARMQLLQQGDQIRGIAYFNGQIQGNLIGLIQGNNVQLQLIQNYGGNTNYQGVVSPDGTSMQLQTGNKRLTVFKTGNLQ